MNNLNFRVHTHIFIKHERAMLAQRIDLPIAAAAQMLKINEMKDEIYHGSQSTQEYFIFPFAF